MFNFTEKVKRKYIPTQIVKIGDEILKRRKNFNSTEKKEKVEVDVDSHYLTVQWQPVLEYPASSGASGNALDQESSRGFSQGVRTNKAKREHNETLSGEEKNATLVLGELVMATTQNTSTENVTNTTVDPDIKLKMSLMGEFIKKEEKKDGPPYEFVKPETTEASVSSESTTRSEIKEPILAATTPRLQGRSSKQEKWQPEVELNPPSMGATETWHLWDSPSSNRRIKNMDLDKTLNTTGPLSALTIQFLPQRLISFLEQAEKYARIAFSPLWSNESDTKSQRRTRLLPQLLWGSEEEKPVTKSEPEAKEESTTKSKLDVVVAIPYQKSKSEFKPKYIPLSSSETDNTKEKKAETNFNRPTMIKEHLEEPIVTEEKEEKEKS